MFHVDTCTAFETRVNILFDRYVDEHRKQDVDYSFTLNDVFFLHGKCIDWFPKAIEQLRQTPTCRRHEEIWDCLLKTLLYPLHLGAMVPKTEEE